MGNFANDTIVYMKRKPGIHASSPEYERYVLENVMVREMFASEADAVEKSSAVVYFLEKGSVCRGPNGICDGLPRPAKGDRCILHFGTKAEMTMRVAEAGYFAGNPLAHIRLKLK